MKFKLCGILLYCCIANVNAQLLQRSLPGVWICREATLVSNSNLPKEEVNIFLQAKNAIISSKFIFKMNGLFEWQFSKEAPPMFKELKFLNNKKWTVNEKEGKIDIGPPKENLMQILVQEKNGITYFILADVPLLLRMEKQTN